MGGQVGRIRLGWVSPQKKDGPRVGLFLIQNKTGRFESDQQILACFAMSKHNPSFNICLGICNNIFLK